MPTFTFSAVLPPVVPEPSAADANIAKLDNSIQRTISKERSLVNLFFI
jgi:hypothetical protein